MQVMYPARSRMPFLFQWNEISALVRMSGEAPGLPLIVDCMGELVEDNELEHEMAAEGFKGPGSDPSNEGQDKE